MCTGKITDHKEPRVQRTPPLPSHTSPFQSCSPPNYTLRTRSGRCACSKPSTRGWRRTTPVRRASLRSGSPWRRWWTCTHAPTSQGMPGCVLSARDKGSMLGRRTRDKAAWLTPPRACPLSPAPSVCGLGQQQSRHVRPADMFHVSDRSMLGRLARTFHVGAFPTCLY